MSNPVPGHNVTSYSRLSKSSSLCHRSMFVPSVRNLSQFKIQKSKLCHHSICTFTSKPTLYIIIDASNEQDGVTTKKVVQCYVCQILNSETLSRTFTACPLAGGPTAKDNDAPNLKKNLLQDNAPNLSKNFSKMGTSINWMHGVVIFIKSSSSEEYSRFAHHHLHCRDIREVDFLHTYKWTPKTYKWTHSWLLSFCCHNPAIQGYHQHGNGRHPRCKGHGGKGRVKAFITWHIPYTFPEIINYLYCIHAKLSKLPLNP